MKLAVSGASISRFIFIKELEPDDSRQTHFPPKTSNFLATNRGVTEQVGLMRPYDSMATR